MATTTANDCVTVTVGVYCNGQRLQYVSRWTRTGGTALNSLQCWQDFKDWFTNIFLVEWVNGMSAGAEVVGWSIEPVIGGRIIPYRENFPLGTNVGALNAPLYSQNVSMLLVGNSADQIATGDKLRTAKTYLGPPPEDKIVTQVLDVAYVNGELTAIAMAMFAPFTGVITATAYARCFGTLSTPVPSPADVQYPVSTFEPRQTVFTQARRLRPII